MQARCPFALTAARSAGAGMDVPQPNGDDCLRLRVHGVVQGVGFRPFVYRLARELEVSGWVRNDAAGVEIEAYGSRERLAALRARIMTEVREPARIDGIGEEWLHAAVPVTGFSIAPSVSGVVRTTVAHDTAVCDECLAELFDPADRRYRYAFTHCTRCGPRYTITASLPYDRAATSMADFTPCAVCAREYENPADRRFHAEANACPRCGPALRFLDGTGTAVAGDPVANALSLLRRGRIVAIKGLGGFHLACDARDAAAVARLRQRKQRDAKPFALMFANVASIAGVADLAGMSGATRDMLRSPERPIVLLRKTAHCDGLLPGIAPGLASVGALLPYAPVHYLLFHEAAGRPAGSAWLDNVQPMVLVMTSANPSGEPLLIDNETALQSLSGIADGFLLHDRRIVARCDDTVLRIDDAAAAASNAAPASPTPPALCLVRRARGFVPNAVTLSQSGPSVIALGGWLKNTVALTRGAQAFLSPHIGDLDNAATCEALVATLEHLQRTLGVVPHAYAHDLHPDFFSSRLAVRLAAEQGVPSLPVQHHHAHVAAVLAEHGVEEAVLGIALDGVGYGQDGTAWGGELLRVDGASCSRLGHLQCLALPGADRAATEPWRMAAAALHALGRGAEIEHRFAHRPGAVVVAGMLQRNLNCPPSSSMGRWFDAAAGLLGISDCSAYEGQAAMLLESLAQAHGPAAALGAGYRARADGTLELLPLLDRLAAERDAARGAAVFHATVIAALAEWVLAAAHASGLRTVALGGGCFMNGILSTGLRRELAAGGLRVLEARQLPPNDGGLALGQAWVARHALARPMQDNAVIAAYPVP